MGLISITASEGGWCDAGRLAGRLAMLPRGGTVTIMIHGYRFAPGIRGHDPHGHILSQHPDRGCWKAISWPRHLHLHRADGGLGIGFGWNARGSLGAVAARAFDIGQILADLIAQIRAQRPDLRINLIAHSLGARVALAALHRLRAGDVARLVLLSGAEYRSHARAAMVSPAGRGARVLNVASRENALFDLIFRILVPAPMLTDWALSAGIADLAGWSDLFIDRPHSRTALQRLGIRLRPHQGAICHWSSYLRPGLFRLYRAVFDPDAPDILDRLDHALAQESRKTAQKRAGWGLTLL
ncbi:esterase/lipase family protein [Roseicyclus sp.]|uniref:esterase/lipase family protein n=1 Tax=Roseicyclus sp. TaxID=1914329 RepID=UPI003F6D9E68